MALLMLKSLFVFALCLLASAEEWAYEGENGIEAWPDMFEACGGDRQSPIDVVTDDLVIATDIEYPITYINYDTVIGWEIANNGHTIVAMPDSRTSAIIGGGLEGVYRLLQFHVHFGSDDTKGSEHTIDGMSYPMELHLVHTMMEYDDLNQVFVDPDGLAVLGIMFEIGEEDNEDMQPFFDAIAPVIYKDEETSWEGMELEKFLPEIRDSGFYRYEGSLTTPQCFETVRWTVFEDTVKISAAQMNLLRGVYGSCDPVNGCGNYSATLDDYEAAADDVLGGDDDTPDSEASLMYNNYRPPQPLAGRTVYYLPAGYVSSSATAAVSFALLALSLLGFFTL